MMSSEKIVKKYYETKCVTDVLRKYKNHFKNMNVSRKHIYKIVNKFERFGSVDDAKKSGQSRVEAKKMLVSLTTDVC